MDIVKLNEHKRAVIYARVSTDEQANKGYSLESQIEACEKYAHAHGLEIVGGRYFDTMAKTLVDEPNEDTLPVRCFVDDYTGTVPIERRPEGKKVFNLLRSGNADAIIAYTVDRLVRPPEEGDEWDTPILIRGLAKLDKEIHTVEDGQLKTDFASLLITMLKARTAGEERRKIIERTSRGKNAKAKANKVVGGGITPYGYRYVDDHLVVLDDEAEIIKMIYRWYVETHLSLYAISVKLTEMGVETPSERRNMRHKMSHFRHTWSASAVYRIISSETYKGKLRYGRRKGSNGCGGKRRDEDTFIVDVPAIVPQDVWDMAQRILEYNAMIAKRHRKNFYLLSGMVRCGCGRSMHAQARPNGHCYRCSEHSAGHAGVTHRQCYEPPFDGAHLEEIVWDYVYSVLTSDFDAHLKVAQEAERQRHQPILSEMDVIRKMLEETEREAEMIARAFSSTSGIVADKLRQEIEQINRRHTGLSAKLASLQADLDRAPLSEGQIEQLQEFRQRVIGGLDHATPEDKRKFYEALQVRVVVKDRKAQISCVITSVISDRDGCHSRKPPAGCMLIAIRLQ